MDNKQGTTLALVDFSAAFDTINHDILIRRLHLRYSFVGKALDWMILYLQERTQRVVIGSQSLSTTTLMAGVPIYSHFDLNPSALAAVLQQMEDCLNDIKKNRWHGILCA